MDLKTFAALLPLSPDQDPIIMGLLDGYELAAPQSFWTAGPDLVREVVGGCGPGGFGDYLVPDTVWFLSIKPACKIHDWMFLVYNCRGGFDLSNEVFEDNMLRINQARTSNRLLKQLRTWRIEKYSRAVQLCGRLSYYDAHLGFYDENVIYAKG